VFVYLDICVLSESVFGNRKCGFFPDFAVQRPFSFSCSFLFVPSAADECGLSFFAWKDIISLITLDLMFEEGT
jgi:hypothetical protein